VGERVRQILADDYISEILRGHNAQLAKRLKSDVLVIKSPIHFGLDRVVRHEVENLHEKPRARAKRLSVLLETTGGFIEVVERIYNVFRKHYSYVEFIVPNFAYSAGTVLVLSGDEIYMDYYSVLGPIDPQYQMDDGQFVPGLGYLQKFDDFLQKVNEAADQDDVRAELAYLLTKFDPARLFHLEQARNHSISLLQAWLPKHKFKNWKRTKSRRVAVTRAMRKARAKEIATILGNPSRWHSHGRGIGIKELSSSEIKLKVVNFGENAALNAEIGTYWSLFQDYCVKMRRGGPDATVIHSRTGLRMF
jgi:hypothetical protein